MAEVEADRVAAARKLQSLYGGVVLLKGAGTVVASSQGVAIVAGSNPGMATGGMGDVLSGVAGALCGQIPDLHQATVLAACAHLAAADHASRHRGYMGLAPTDVIEALPEVFRRLETDRASAGERT